VKAASDSPSVSTLLTLIVPKGERADGATMPAGLAFQRVSGGLGWWRKTANLQMSKVPRHVGALLAALKFRDAHPEALRVLNDSEWKQLLGFCDEMHLTLVFGRTCRDHLPDWVRARIDQNFSANAQKFERLKSVYAELSNGLRQAGAEHLVLKGFAQWAGYVRDPHLRMQSDIDIFCPSESVISARDAIAALGYEPLKGIDDVPSDHLPSMIRQNDWKWRGDFFDPEAPFSVDIHFRFWHEENVRFGPKGLDQFWPRRAEGQSGGINFSGLDPADSVGYSTLHALRHLLCGGGLLTFHIYELAWFLHTTTDDTAFWSRWREWHHDSLRRLEGICFALAKDWFNCRLPEDAQKEVDGLPKGVKQWLRTEARASLYTLFRPNKNTLWLHLSLLESSRDKRAIFRQVLLPTRIPPVDAFYIQDSPEHGGMRQRGRLERRARHFHYLTRRAAYHLHILPGTLWRGLRWWWKTKNPRKRLRTFLAVFLC
jgi:hypothetical protein